MNNQTCKQQMTFINLYFYEVFLAYLPKRAAELFKVRKSVFALLLWKSKWLFFNFSIYCMIIEKITILSCSPSLQSHNYLTFWPLLFFFFPTSMAQGSFQARGLTAPQQWHHSLCRDNARNLADCSHSENFFCFYFKLIL